MQQTLLFCFIARHAIKGLVDLDKDVINRIISFLLDSKVFILQFIGSDSVLSLVIVQWVIGLL